MLRHHALLCTVLFITSCANEEQEQMLAQLQTDLTSANAAIDSLTYTLDDSNLLLDALRAKADSAQSVNEKLIRDVQGLNKSLREFRNLAEQRKVQNDRLQAEIRRMKEDKQADSRTIAGLRGQADSLNSVLLETHTSIRRQSDHIRQLEMDLAQTQDQVSTLKAAQRSVRLYAAGEKFLEENDPYGVAGLTEVDSMLTFDAHYSIELMEGSLRLTGSALNLTDERAPLEPHEQGYDAYTHNPLGRVFQIGLRYTLGDG